ncbi:MAG: mycofactocin biosynthesis glycosyltransferase MftF [Acidimicrobiales bacterium]
MTGRTSAASSPSTERFLLDRRVRRYGSGRLLLGGEPARLFRLSERGAVALDRLIESGEAREDEAPDDEATALAHRLVGAGVLHPLPDPGTGPTLLDITAVVPVRDPPDTFGALLEALGRSGARDVVVVDDGSADGGAASVAAAEEAGAQVICRPTSGGPACARNAARPTSAIVAYLDADTVLDEEDPGEWLRRCAAHFADERVAIVAPRIASVPRGAGARTGARAGAGAGELSGPARWIEAYEELESPLDLGPHPGLVGKGRRLSYVPAAGLVVRRAAVEEAGGFDEALRYGEDVDLLRRVESAGWLVRYEPASVVMHRPRRDLGSFARQRVAYGSAAASIERRHPGTVAPYIGTPAATLSGAALIASWLCRRRSSRWAGGCLVVALAGTGFPVRRLARRLGEAECPRPVRLASELSVRSTLWGTVGLLAAVRRAWWPIVLPGLLLRRTRRSALVLLATAAAAGHGLPAIRGARSETAPSSRFARLRHHLVLGVIDDASYGTGVLLGCWREGSVRALAPQVKRPPTVPPAG